MSRDLTPKELDYLIKATNAPNLTESLMITYNGITKPAYSEDQKNIGRKYPRLNRFGFDMLMRCKNSGIFNTQKGTDLIQQVENYFNDIYIEDKDLSTKIQLWYEGQLEPGYYMGYNDEAFVNYIKSKCDD